MARFMAVMLLVMTAGAFGGVAQAQNQATPAASPVASPYQAASRGYIDNVIEPHATRRALTRALAIARSKRAQTPPRKHGNIPL
jgi:propionyl-CoA carboxylase beta chain